MGIYKKKSIDRDVYSLSLERVRYVIDRVDNFAVMFSGGKDSTCVLNLVAQVATEDGLGPVRVIYIDEEAIPYEVENYMRRVGGRVDIDLEWYCIPVKHMNACSLKTDSWITWNPDKRDLWVRKLPYEAITSIKGYDTKKKVMSIPEISPLFFPPSAGISAVFMGIRAAESLTRYQAVSRRVEENYIVKSQRSNNFGGSPFFCSHIWKAYPIYDWQTEDVWTAMNKFGWDYCSAYDLWEMAGIGHHYQRLAPPFGTQPSMALWKYQICHPELWERMINRVPGARTAARYKGTEVYNESNIIKPDGLTWMEYIAKIIGGYDNQEVARVVASHIRSYIRTHEKKTGGLPILERVAHPLSGVTWELLAKIATRKDNKGRMRPDTNVPSPFSPSYQKHLETYYRVMAELNRE